MHRFSGQGSHEDKIPPPPLSRLRAGGSVQTAVQSGGSNAAETRGLAGRGSRLPVSPWRQPRAGPSYGGAGRGLPWPGQKDLRAVPSPEVQTAPHRDDPSFLFSLAVHTTLSCLGDPRAVVAARIPTCQRNRPREGPRVAQSVKPQVLGRCQDKTSFIHLFHKYLSRPYS